MYSFACTLFIILALVASLNAFQALASVLIVAAVAYAILHLADTIKSTNKH